LYFFKTSNINIDSMKKINDFKNNAFQMSLKNLNSFKTMLKMMKMMQMY